MICINLRDVPFVAQLRSDPPQVWHFGPKSAEGLLGALNLEEGDQDDEEDVVDDVDDED